MSFVIALSFHNVPGILQNIFVLCRRSLDIILPPICPCLETEEHPLTATELMKVFLFFVVCPRIRFSLHSEVNRRALCVVTGTIHQVHPCCLRLWLLLFCDLRWSWSEKHLSPIFFVKFDNSYLCFWRHGVVQQSCNAARLINVQSSVLCDSQVNSAHCIKIWYIFIFVMHHSRIVRGGILENRATTSPIGPWLTRSMLVFLCDHWCLTRYVLIRRSTCNCLKILHGRCVLATHTESRAT